ncbi:MAG: phosphoribosylglycinamide formyltransferase [Thermoplasmatota archaeon]
MLRVAVLASGSGSNLQSILAKSKQGLLDATVSLVITDRPGAGCLDHARAAGVPAIVELPRLDGESRDAYDARLIECLAAEAPDLIVLAGFMRILSPSFCDAFAGQIINIHPALLPKHKGAHGIRDTLAAGDAEAGCTTHWVTAELDGGPHILQARLPVHADDTQASLAARVLRMEHWLLPRTIQLIAEGRVASDGRIAPGSSWVDLPGLADASWSDGF